MMEKHIKAMVNQTDLVPWYWISHGEKCYAFAVVEAFPCDDKDGYPAPGSQLQPDGDGFDVCIGENGVKMMINDWLVEIERQNGDTICGFIAMSHATLLGDFLPTAGHHE